MLNPFVKSSPRLDTQSQAHTASYVALLIYVELARCGRCWYRSQTRRKEYNKAYGTCKALGELLTAFFFMCLAHSDSWWLIRKKNEMQEVLQTSDTFDISTVILTVFGLYIVPRFGDTVDIQEFATVLDGILGICRLARVERTVHARCIPATCRACGAPQGGCTARTRTGTTRFGTLGAAWQSTSQLCR